MEVFTTLVSCFTTSHLIFHDFATLTGLTSYMYKLGFSIVLNMDKEDMFVVK